MNDDDITAAELERENLRAEFDQYAIDGMNKRLEEISRWLDQELSFFDSETNVRIEIKPSWRTRMNWWREHIRERVALKIAPWLEGDINDA